MIYRSVHKYFVFFMLSMIFSQCISDHKYGIPPLKSEAQQEEDEGKAKEKHLKCLYENFEDENALDSYKIISFRGDSTWHLHADEVQTYLQIKAQKTKQAIESWLIIPIDFDSVDQFSFKSRFGEQTQGNFRVFINTEYLLGSRIKKDKWEDISKAFSFGSKKKGKHKSVFSDAGVYDLSSHKGQGAIAFVGNVPLGKSHQVQISEIQIGSSKCPLRTDSSPTKTPEEGKKEGSNNPNKPNPTEPEPDEPEPNPTEPEPDEPEETLKLDPPLVSPNKGGSNPLRNPDFSIWNNNIPLHWGALQSSGVFHRSNESEKGGAALQCINTSTKSKSISSSTYIEQLPKKKYKVTLYVKGRGSIAADFYSLNQKRRKNPKTKYEEIHSDSYKPITFMMSTARNKDGVILMLYYKQTDKDQGIYIDYVSLEAEN